MPKRYPSSADTDAMVERVAPAILELLADGVPRSRRAIAAELARPFPGRGGRGAGRALKSSRGDAAGEGRGAYEQAIGRAEVAVTRLR